MLQCATKEELVLWEAKCLALEKKVHGLKQQQLLHDEQIAAAKSRAVRAEHKAEASEQQLRLHALRRNEVRHVCVCMYAQGL